jgi:hypothetical protein
MLSGDNLYAGEIDGKRGPKTNGAINAALTKRPGDLPEDWWDWPPKRKAVAFLQLLCEDKNIDPGPIDGFYGPRTENAAYHLRVLITTGERPRAFGDIIPIIANPHDFPLEREEKLNDYYGKPCKIPKVKVPCPWTLRLDWDLSTTTNTILIHEDLSDSLAGILEKAYDHYGLEGIKEHGLDRYGGSYNCRKKRGSSAWSTHAWAISIDWYPSRNKLRWGCDKASLAHPDLDAWWEFWEREGWMSLGRSENRDWMHVQAAKR